MVVPKTKGSSTKLKGESGDFYFILLTVLERKVENQFYWFFLFSESDQTHACRKS